MVEVMHKAYSYKKGNKTIHVPAHKEMHRGAGASAGKKRSPAKKKSHNRVYKLFGK